MKKEKESSTRNPNEKNDIMILAIAKSVHYSSKHFSNAAMLDERKRERANLETMLARVTGIRWRVDNKERQRRREILFGHFSRDYSSACLRTTLYLYLSLFLSVDSFLTHVERR